MGRLGQFAVKVLGVWLVVSLLRQQQNKFRGEAGAARAAAAMAGMLAKNGRLLRVRGVKKFTGGLLLKGGDRLEKAEIFGKSAYGVLSC